MLLLLVWLSVQRKNLTGLVACSILTLMVFVFLVDRELLVYSGEECSTERSPLRGVLLLLVWLSVHRKDLTNDHDSWRLKLAQSYLDLIWVEMFSEF